MVACSFTPRSGMPRYKISPTLGGTKPVIMRSSVDLPQPDGPNSATNSPSRISKLIFSTARIWRCPLPKNLPTPLSSTKMLSLLLLGLFLPIVPEPPFSKHCVLFHSITFFGDAIQAPPEKAVERHHDHNHRQGRGEKYWIISRRRRFGNLRAQSSRVIRLSAKRDVFGNYRCVPTAARRRNHSRNQVRKHGRQNHRTPARPTAQAKRFDGIHQIARNRRRARDDIEQHIPLRAHQHQYNRRQIQPTGKSNENQNEDGKQRRRGNGGCHLHKGL